MIRPLATFIHVLDAARTAGTLARTVLVLSRQLDNAHLLAASEEARADRAELRVAELEAQTRDWAELSGELAREQPTADPLPSVLDAGEAPIPLVLTDSAREADIQRDRADALQRALQACEVELQQTRAQLRQTEAAAGAHIATISALREQIAAAHRAAHAPARSLEERADIARRAWDESPPADPGPVEWDELPLAGQAAWCAVVRACDTSAAAEQIPGVAAARTLSRLECTICPYVARELDEEAGDKCPACGSKLAEVESCDACGKPARDGERTGEAEAVLLCGRCRAKAEAEEAARTSATLTLAAHGNDPQRGTAATAAYRATIEAARATAGTEIEPPTRPSERAATRTT